MSEVQKRGFRTRKRSIDHTERKFGKFSSSITIQIILWMCMDCLVWSWTTNIMTPMVRHWGAYNQHRPSALLLHSADEHSDSKATGRRIVDQMNNSTNDSTRPLCFYRSPINNRWKQRIDIESLTIGQELQGIIMQEKLTNTTTGPKLWLDVGVCRWSTKSNAQGAWTICTALLRLGRANYQKESVLRKKVARLRSKNILTVFVSRIRLEQGQFEVVLTQEEIPPPRTSKLQPVSKLNVGDDVTGTVVRVEDYGVLIQMDGYNRHGLLHIQRVADLYQTFIDKKTGLIESGLDLKSRLKLQVVQKDAKRVFLDFTGDVKQIAMEELEQEKKETEQKQNQLREELQRQREASVAIQLGKQMTSSIPDQDVNPEGLSTFCLSIGTSETEAGEIYERDEIDDAEGEEYDDSEDDGEYDSYDEERDIEDALGLGTY